MTEPQPHPGPSAVDEAAALRVAEGLKVAFQAVATADLPDERKPDLQRRLIAITNSAKHDVATAERRLRDFLEELGAPWPADAG